MRSRCSNLSASLLILKPLAIQGYGDRELDLRVDEHRDPFGELRRILNAVRSRDPLTEANAKLAANDVKGALERGIAAREQSLTSDAAWVTLAAIHLRLGAQGKALEAVAHAVQLNPANKKQLLRNDDFLALRKDPEFLAIVSP